MIGFLSGNLAWINYQEAMEHTVTFRFKHAAGSEAEAAFLSAAAELASLPGAKDLKICRQICPKNSHTFSLSMNFDSQEAFQSYCEHPLQIEFVEIRWIPEVENFQETDFETL
ncbi:MAG: Dabb family protein [Akkermansiaceae bacterium]|nr:Dabb family protein [Akkermansiaceae bacterium]